MDILPKAQVKVILHLPRYVCAHCEEIVRREPGGGVTYRIDCHAQQDILHLIAILRVDGIDLVRHDFVLEGDLEHQRQAVLRAAGNRREGALLGIL